MDLGDSVEIIKKVPRGKKVLRRTDAKQPVYSPPQPETSENKGERPTLTTREKEVLSLVILGKSSQEVAVALGLLKRTVDYHLSNIYHKLKVSNRLQAFHEAVRLGLISVEPFTLSGEL